MPTLNLPTSNGAMAPFTTSAPRDFPSRANRPFNRIAYSAAHVVADPRSEGNPWLEAAIDWEMVGWRGLLLPLDTPQAIVSKLSDALVEITQSEAYQSFMKKNGFGIELKQGSEFNTFLQTEDAKWKKVIEATGYASK